MKTDERARRKINLRKTNKRLKGESWKYYENYLDEKAPETQNKYLRNFIGFLEFLDTDTEGLYSLYLGMIKNEDPRKRKKMGMLVIDYQKHLMESTKVKGGSTRHVVDSVKGFFNANELPLKVERKITHDPIEIPNISKDQISKVLDATGSYKMKAATKFARDSGLRIGDITNLPIRVVRAALDDPSVEFHTFEWKQQKTKRYAKPLIANPVLGLDSLDAVRTWMNYRVNTLGISAEDGDPLFCAEQNRNEYTDISGRYVREIVKGDWMGEGAIGACFSRLVRKADLKPLPGNTRRPTIHSFRKYHKTILEKARVPTSWINKMQGRKGEGTGGTYTKPDPDMLIEMYREGYPALSGIEEGQHEKIEKLTHELGLSQYEMAGLREEREELRAERDKYRAEYDSRSRLQGLIDQGILAGWPEEIIKKLEENLESVETFEDGVFEFHKLEKELDENWDFKIVDEEAEMILNTRDGWKIFKALNDGRYVMRRHL